MFQRPGIRPRKCKHCRESFMPEKHGQLVHVSCVEPYIKALNAKKRAKQEADRRAKAKVERAQIKARRRELETIPELIRAADKAFAAFIRERDRQAGHPCISSGKPLDWSGNQVDAGHFRSRGAASHLRYDPRNCHAQSKYENRHRAGNAIEYRIRLIERIGLEQVEDLEASNEPHKWTHEELRDICDTYRTKLKELKKGQAGALSGE